MTKFLTKTQRFTLNEVLSKLAHNEQRGVSKFSCFSYMHITTVSF